MTAACSVQVRGVVQGVGFRPFVFRLARAHTLAGWVRNGDDGVEIYVEGAGDSLEQFLSELSTLSPPAARIAALDVLPSVPSGVQGFEIRESAQHHGPTTRIAPDLAVCAACIGELFDPSDPRFRYPYINCTNCGPRYSVIRGLPYDRSRTTMAEWPLDRFCALEFSDPDSRRFHAQPVACPSCGPGYRLTVGSRSESGPAAIARAATFLAEGAIVAVKGLGGYHLACDARNESVVLALRERKYRKEKPFAIMAASLDVAGELVELTRVARELMLSVARPIVLAPAIAQLPGVAPDTDELGVMLPYTPLHYLLFAAGAPRALVMTSGNRSNEPIAYEDGDALVRLSGIADAFLIGERPIARRVDDSVVRAGSRGPIVLRRARGYAPGAVAAIPGDVPVLAVGADLKSAVTLVVAGQAFVSQHIGDLDLEPCRRAFRETIGDLLDMYEVDPERLVIAHDAHPEYASTRAALEMTAVRCVPVQHHRAHVLSVLAERSAWETPVLGVSFDGTGYGDDGSVWGGEIFAGSLVTGLERVAHLRRAWLPGGDAAARYPIQAAAGFLAGIDGMPDLSTEPFGFPRRYGEATQLVTRGVRVTPTTSVGRLFDVASALLGFTGAISYEGQAAIWLEQHARDGVRASRRDYELPYEKGEFDFRPLLRAVAADRISGVATESIALGFHAALSRAVVAALTELGERRSIATAVLSGGVFQNRLLLDSVRTSLERGGFEVWTNQAVPPNDGGISLGQAAFAAFQGRA